MFNGTLTGSGGYSTVVNLRCLGAVPLTCRLAPATLTPTPLGAAFTVTASNDAQDHFNFTIHATGTDTAHIHQSTPMELIVGFNFVINNNSASQTVAGPESQLQPRRCAHGKRQRIPRQRKSVVRQSGNAFVYHLHLYSRSGGFRRRRQNVVLKVVTTAASPSANLTETPHLLWYDLGLTLTGVVLALGGIKRSRRRRKKAGRLAILCPLLGLLVGCGGGSSGGSGGSGGGVDAGHPGTTPGNYTITVTGAVGSVTRTADIGLIVK